MGSTVANGRRELVKGPGGVLQSRPFPRPPVPDALDLTASRAFFSGPSAADSLKNVADALEGTATVRACTPTSRPLIHIHMQFIAFAPHEQEKTHDTLPRVALFSPYKNFSQPCRASVVGSPCFSHTYLLRPYSAAAPSMELVLNSPLSFYDSTAYS